MGDSSVTHSYIIKSELTEKQIEADVAMYLGWCSADMPFRLLDINEEATGADKLFNVTVPIYMQFKKSEGLSRFPEPSFKMRANESPLQSIRRFRSRNQLSDDPTLFFGLRALAKQASDFQHNVLFAHHHPSKSYAVYVAPLYLEKQRYYEELCSGPRYLPDPWEWRNAEIISDYGRHSWLSRYGRQPFLRNHISIIPHVRVSCHRHYYAYSVSGDEVSWHSPSIIDGGPFRLSDFMSLRTREIMTGDEILASPEAALSVAESVIKNLSLDAHDVFHSETPFDRLRDYGRWLWQTYDIRQFLLCADRDFLSKIRRG